MTKFEESRFELTEFQLKSIQKQIRHWNNHVQVVDMMRSRYLNDYEEQAA